MDPAEQITWELDVVITGPKDTDIDDFIFYIEGQGVLDPAYTVSVSDVRKDD